MKHELKRVDEERDSDGYTRWRWVCTCTTRTGRNIFGRWNYQSDNVARVAWQQHELRSRPKPKGPKAVRDLLKFDY